MVTVYCMDIGSLLEESHLQRLLQSVPSSQRDKINRIANKSSKAQSLGAYLLAARAVQLWEQRQLNQQDQATQQGQAAQQEWISDLPALEFTKGKYGKPVLSGHPGIYVNWSHSGSYVAVSIGDEENGVDIQEHQKGYLPHVAERFFHEEEKKRLAEILQKSELEAADPQQEKMRIRQEQLAVFYEIWTKKEAYIKYTGLGMAQDLRLFDTANLNGAECYSFDKIAGYSIAFCCAKSTELYEKNHGLVLLPNYFT